MRTGLYYFMIVAREKSISHAAQALMVTQQSLSEQIRRLEDVYGNLFIRKPRFQLTPAGEALLRTTRQIYVLERSLDTELQEIREKKVGQLRMGIHSLRAMVLLPSVIEKYRESFPNVNLTFHNDDTVTLEEMLRCGELDVFFGVDAHCYPEFEYIRLGDERIYLVASEEFAQANFGMALVEGRDVLEISEIKNISFIFRHNRSNFQSKINKFFCNFGITPKVSISITDFNIQLKLVGRNMGACFCPHLALRMVTDINRVSEGNILRIFTIKGMDVTSKLTLVKHKYGINTEYLNVFISMLRNAFATMAVGYN